MMRSMASRAAAFVPRAMQAPRRAFTASPAAQPRPRRMAASRRQLHASVVAQSLEKKVLVEGSGASPKQGDKVSPIAVLHDATSVRKGRIGPME